MTVKELRSKLSNSSILLILKNLVKSVWSVVSISRNKTKRYTTDSPQAEACKAVLSQEDEKILQSVDWSVKDVLVGSLGSVEQLKDNIARLYYYVPVANVLEDLHSVRYVALYQSLKMFGDNCGIQYYGEIAEMKRVKRKNISFPIRRNNGEEWYYAFRIKEWKTLPIAIYVKDEGVYKPKCTNLFLLLNCEQSYELFSVQSSEQYRLLRALKLMQDDFIMTGKSGRIYKIYDGKSVWTQDDRFSIRDDKGDRLLDVSFKIADFANHPKVIYDYIRNTVGCRK